MTPQEIAVIISIARRAPLANMSEAEGVAQLLQKLASHFAPKQPSSEDDARQDEVSPPS
jgi:hypothetical protein